MNVFDLEVNHDVSETDEESDVRGWVTCKSHCYVNKYGDPQVLVGRTFTLSKDFGKKAAFAEKCPHGKLHSVVRRQLEGDESAKNAELYFKIYNHQLHRKIPSPDSEGISS